MNKKAALFGGALMAAGMTAQVQAQNFIYLDSGLGGAYQSFAYSVAYGGAGDVAYAPGLLNTFSSNYSAYTGTTTVQTIQTASMMRAEGSWDGGGALGYGYGSAQFQQFFMVDAPGQLLVEWDFSGTDGYAGAVVLETAGGATVFSLDGLAGDPFSGSALVDVDPGIEYAFLGGLINGFAPFYFTSGDTQFVQISTIPTPGIAGIFGVAGLAATRRRRA